jgi:hypothetical protein
MENPKIRIPMDIVNDKKAIDFLSMLQHLSRQE